MRRRDDDYVDGAELDDSDELVEDESDDSDEFHALPSLPNAPVRTALAERSSNITKRRPMKLMAVLHMVHHALGLPNERKIIKQLPTAGRLPTNVLGTMSKKTRAGT